MRTKGTVKWFHKRKGWGFITPVNGSEGDEDVFVHYSQIDSDEKYKMLEPQEEVTFDIVQTENGPAAYRVRKI